MAETPSTPDGGEARKKLTSAMWMALIAAFLGWMFDGMEMGIYANFIRPALVELMGPGSEPRIPMAISWTLSLFLVGMAAGGILFGRLGDRIGRVRSMALAILTYAIFTGLSGFATRWEHIAACRFLGAMGLGGEWGAGVALVMETWPNASRPLMAGVLGAAANFGFLASSGIAWLARYFDWGWRQPLWCGAIPAFLVFFLRLGIKEPERYVKSKERGEESRLRDLFVGETRRRTLVGSGLGAIAVLGMWGAWQCWLPSWAPDLAAPQAKVVQDAGKLADPLARPGTKTVSQEEAQGVVDAARKAAPAAQEAAELTRAAQSDAQAAAARAEEAASKLEEAAESPGAAEKLRFDAASAAVASIRAAQLTIKRAQATARAAVPQWMAIGSIFGAIIGGLIGGWMGRRPSYALLCLCSLAVTFPLYFTVHEYGTRLLVLTFLSGIPITAFFGWLPLYLPELYPTRLRATGEGFCFNVGRVVSAIGVFGTGALAASVGIPHAAAYMSLIFLLGLPVIALAPETKGQELPE
ncbi:MAG: MFS transporter [Armatimonadetes bacterium]|nr:MFS transporter [Armatimonadota bacterium]